MIAIYVGMYIAIIPNRGSPPASRLRRVLRDEPLAPVDQLFEVVASTHHGHVQAVRLAMQRLGVDTLIASRPCRERELVVAMVAARVLEPDSKLATPRWRHPPTLPGGRGGAGAA